MDNNWKKAEIIFELISVSVGIVALILDYKKPLLYFIIFLLIILTGISLSFWIKNYPLENKFKFARYLFFESIENKFNIAPKIVLFADLKKLRNPFSAESLEIKYEITQHYQRIDSNASWKLKNISNVCVDHFYLYAGTDLGKIKNQEMIIYCNDIAYRSELLDDNIDDSENDVFLYHWNIPGDSIKQNNKLDMIELKMLQENSFDFSNKEVIYLFPWNYAKKIERINFTISFSDEFQNISMQLFEVGKISGENYPSHRSLDTKSYKKMNLIQLNFRFLM